METIRAFYKENWPDLHRELILAERRIEEETPNSNDYRNLWEVCHLLEEWGEILKVSRLKKIGATGKETATLLAKRKDAFYPEIATSIKNSTVLCIKDLIQVGVE